MNSKTFKLFALITYILMIIVNALANILPINNITTGAVSDNYPNLFAPAGFTFAIWGLIYLTLGIYIIGQFSSTKPYTREINLYFGLSSLLNSLWILSWHYQFIPVSWILMIFILLCLIKINTITQYDFLSVKDSLINRRVFEIYFGWITVATIANTTTLLVSLNFNFLFNDTTWLLIISTIGAVIGITTIIRRRAIFYGLVFIWAYWGIYYKLQMLGIYQFERFWILLLIVAFPTAMSYTVKRIIEERT